jgi:hypothetical protein
MLVSSRSLACLLLALLFAFESVSSFHLVLMGARRGKLNNLLSDDPSSSKVPNAGKGQEITGVTLPAEGQLKGWQFGQDRRLVCANIDSVPNKIQQPFYALQGECPRCGFDLWKGDLIVSATSQKDDLPRPCVACPTCRTTYSLKTGKPGPAFAKPGLRAVVGQLALTATSTGAGKSAQVYRVTRETETGRVYIREV